MKLKTTVLLAGVSWVGLISLLHLTVNLRVFDRAAQAGTQGQTAAAETVARGPRFSVGYVPVTCHLTCPVTDVINKQTAGQGTFRPMRFNGFPEIKEMFL